MTTYTIEQGLDLVKTKNKDKYKEIYAYGFFNLSTLVTILESEFDFKRITDGSDNYYFISE